MTTLMESRTCVEHGAEVTPKSVSCNCGRSSAPELQGIRKANCTCSCMGLPGGDLEAYDSEAVQRCLGDCGDQEIKCDQACRGQKDQKKQKECLDSCSLRKHQCRCECNSTKEH
ncbi:hypothetical protein FOCC_FOCC008375 [Frankliniella occidentalis]|nr:hypothetical protein FOCC_FOCC008375 [Frankliniella occidentalis]